MRKPSAWTRRREILPRWIYGAGERHRGRRLRGEHALQNDEPGNNTDQAYGDAFTLNKPEIFIGNCTSKIDETTGEISDDATRNFIKRQLVAFAKLIAQVSGKV